MFKRIKEKYSHKSKNTKFLIVSLLVSVVILLSLTAILLATIIRGGSNGNDQREYRNYAGSLVLASKAVTYEVFNYVATGQTAYYDNYLSEMERLDSLKKDAENLPDQGIDAQEMAIIENIID
jgi:hypothetical protein